MMILRYYHHYVNNFKNMCILRSAIQIKTDLTYFLLVRFKGCPVIAVAAKPGGPEAPDTVEPQGITELIDVS